MDAKYLAIHFQGKGHMLEIPSNCSEFLNQIQLAFMNEIPSSWTLQYDDPDGDRVIMATESDFEIFLKEYPKLGDHIQLEIVSNNKEASFIEEVDFTSENLEGSEKDLADSFNVVEEDGQVIEHKDEIMEIDFSDIMSPEDLIEKEEASVIKADGSDLDKKSTSAVEMINSPDFEPDQKKIIEVETPTLIIENPVDREGRQLISPLRLVERSSQTIESPVINKEDRLILTQTKMMGNQDRGFQFSPNLDYEITEHSHISRVNSLVYDDIDTTSRAKPKRVIKTVHTQCYCDGCGMCPIVGIRYRCSVCEDFDFCERCEATKEHPHLFLRIKNPKEYTKLKHNAKNKSLLGDYGDEFSFKDLGRKLKETTLAKVMSNTYGQLPEHLSKLFTNIKSGIARVYEDSSSDEQDSSNDDLDSQSDVLPQRESTIKYTEKRK